MGGRMRGRSSAAGAAQSSHPYGSRSGRGGYGASGRGGRGGGRGGGQGGAGGGGGGGGNFYEDPGEYQPAAEGLLTLRKEGSDVAVTLTPFQVRRIFTGQTSVNVKPHWRAIGIAYTAYKALKGQPGDRFHKHLEPSKAELERCAKEGLPAPTAVTETLTGPVELLEPYTVRELSLRQANDFGQDARYLHVIYDRIHIVFVDEQGDCLYLEKAQLQDAAEQSQQYEPPVVAAAAP